MKYLVMPTNLSVQTSHTHYADEPANDMYDMQRACDKMVELLTSPPESWHAYIKEPGGSMKILEMEMTEVRQKYLAMKTETGTHSDFTKELCHLMAAAAHTYLSMTCKTK